MFWLKACPKCQADLYGSKDVYGAYVACLQCSRYLTESEESLLKEANSGSGIQAVAIPRNEPVAA
ncbi:MAG: hypothetical protein QF659_05095 [Dehalococcoidia bacterium]|jgi:hypothetical protein|nr:hypothetical protein [Dehalococcoidia bacterium]